MENNFYRYEKRNGGGPPRGFEPRPPAPQAGALSGVSGLTRIRYGGHINP